MRSHMRPVSAAGTCETMFARPTQVASVFEKCPKYCFHHLWPTDGNVQCGVEHVEGKLPECACCSVRSGPEVCLFCGAMMLTFACPASFRLSREPRSLGHSHSRCRRWPRATEYPARYYSPSVFPSSRDAASTRTPVSCAGTSKEAVDDEELLRTEFDAALSEMESSALRDMGTTEVTLAVFAEWLLAGRLNLFPPYQRDYVWKPVKASRLVATVLCRRHVPPVVLHEKEEGVFDVVDGKQRLTSMLGFLLNGRKYQARLKELALQPKLEKILPQLKELVQLDESYQGISGLTFDLLPPKRQSSYDMFTLAYVKIPMDTPSTDVFEVYDDINSGGENLQAQQVRRAVYYGPYIVLLDKIAESHEDFHVIRDAVAVREKKYEPCKKHSDRELILRAFAFRENGERFQTPLKTFLNRELEGSSNFDERNEIEKKRSIAKMEEKEREFQSVMKFARTVFGDYAFRRWAPRRGSSDDFCWDKNISTNLWDAMYSALAELSIEGYKQVDFTKAKGAIVQSLKTAFESKTLDVSQLRAKTHFLERKETLKTLLRDSIKKSSPVRASQRAFPTKLRRPLYDEQGGRCAICGQEIELDRIDDGRYVHIDHRIPHSNGGQTLRGNAQLAHAECNREKSAATPR